MPDRPASRIVAPSLVEIHRHHSPALDATATALAFITGYLKFTGINGVVSHSIQGTEALVAVGYPIESHAPGTAAVLQLAKFGTGADAGGRWSAARTPR